MAQEDSAVAAAATGAASRAPGTADSELKQRKGAAAGQAQQPSASDAPVAAETSGKDDGKDSQGKQKVMGRTHSGASESILLAIFPSGQPS